MSKLRGVGSRLIGVFKSIGTTLLNGIASYAISLGVSKLFGLIKSAWDELSGAAERKLQKNAIKKMTEDVSELKEKSESLDDVAKKFEELKRKTEDANISVEDLLKTKQELADLQDTLPSKYQQEFEGIDLVNGGLEEQLEILKEIQKQNANEFLYGENGALEGSEDKHGKTKAQRAYEQIYKKPNKDDFGFLNDQALFFVPGDYGKKDIATRLAELSEGGEVNLNLRPEIDTSELKKVGWDIEEGIATVFTSTFSNKSGTKYLNFTPIIVDPETGEYKGVLSEDDLQQYAEEVIEGVRTDDLNLQIGTEFSSISEAEKAAEEIHNLHELLSNGETSYGRIRNINDYYGFDISSILKKNGIEYYAGTQGKDNEFKFIDDELLDNLPEYGEEEAIAFYLAFDEDATSKEISQAITNVRAELSQKYGDNERAKDFLEYIGNVKTGYNAEDDATAREFLETMARQYMISTGVNYEEEANEAEKAYAEALATYQKDASDANKEAFNEAARRLDEVKDNVDNYMAGISDTYVTEGMTNLFDSIWDTTPLTSNEKLQKYFGDRINGFIQVAGELSEREKQVILSMLDGTDVENLVMDDIIKIVTEAKAYVENNPINIEVGVKASDAVDSMADMKSAVASLSDLYNQSVLQAASENADNFGTFAADPATLNSIESAFSKFIEEKSSSGSDVSELNAALDEFERISVEAYGAEDYSEQMQKAIDNLITAYIDQTDVIKNLTEENAEWSKAQLKAMGIENADAVVTAKLSKKTKELMTNVTKLAKAYDKLDDMQVGSEEYSKGLEEIASAVKDMLDLGDVADDFNISTGFVTKNLDLIKEAASGSGEAINQLRKEAAKEITAQIHIEGNPQEVLGYQTYINDLIDNFDIEDIQVGTRLDDDPMIQGLNNLVKAGIMTRDNMNNILAGIGVVPDVDGYEEIPITMENLHSAVAATGARGTAAAQMEQAMRNNSNAVVRLPKFGYKLASKGTTANYSAPSTSGSSGGGGGGGGSEPTQPKEESEETFDWIEVAIQRIEEEISRLDKVVGNSYDLWINRNEALVKEMEKTTEEIKAQQLAQSEYLRNANAVQVNNGKGLNDDDYGENDELVKANDQKLLDEARAAWATGEYQRKVREGQMSGDDIEKIQNHFLSETIQFYQELYNKSVAAGDAVQDLQINLGELARTNFDHVKSEYEELIQYITDSADIINEKINRTEEHGYFVSKSYYQDLLKLESGNLAYLEGEYEDLIKKRDEAVAAGYIAESSSEWNQMNQEINAVNKSIEESKTKTVELNNAIRQLEWDRFDWLEDRISKINEEASFLIDLMSNDQLYEDNGKLTGLGHSTNAMYAVQYETYMRQARDYAEERKKLEKEMAADPANKNLVERYEDLVAAQQDAIKGAEQMKDAVKSLVEEGFNRFLSSLQKLIDEYKKAQTEAKDLYTYQQNIAEQTKNIGNLRKQLTAYAGDDNEETRATRQRLQTQLEDAEKKLQETQWDKYISETEKFLDDMYSDMEETLNARLDNIDLLMQDMINVANEHSALVNQTITEEAEKVGYTLTEGVRAILNGGEGSLVTYINGVTNAVTNVSVVLETIKNLVASMVDNGKKTVEAESKATSTGKTTTTTAPTSNGGTGGKTSGTTTNTNTGKTNNTGSGTGVGTSGNSSTPKRTDEDYYGVALAIINGTLGWGNGDERFRKLKAKGFDDDKVMNIVNKLWNEGYVFSNAWVGRYYGIKDLSKYAYNKYAKGSKNITKDQLAWTQEKGQELIFRSTDGAMLTPLNAGDKVFTAQMTDNLWELAKGKFSTVPKSTGGNTINNSNAISITLPNVKNYEEFKTALQNDPKMTAFIQQITLGEVTNGVRLNKKKY